MHMHTTEASVKLTVHCTTTTTTNTKPDVYNNIHTAHTHTLTQKPRAWNNETVLNLLAEETNNSLV